MTRQQIIDLQKSIGTEPDGFWGPKSSARCQYYLRRMMPDPNPWPTPDDASMRRFYGRPGDEDALTMLDADGIGIKYAGQPVSVIRCHYKVAESLKRVLLDISHGTAAWILEEYAGCFNYRAMRGGSRMSKHAWGVAIDFAPGRNGLRTHWPTEATMPIEAMESFAKEGWTSAGAFWGRDAMHFEATRA